MAFLAGAACLLVRWAGYERRTLKAWVVAVPVLGAAILIAAPVYWVLDRRRDFLGVRARRPVYLAWLLAAAFWVATVPFGDVLMARSAEVSKARAAKVVAAAVGFRERWGRWPESPEELDRNAGWRLPEPTLGHGFTFYRREGGFQIEFSAERLWSSRRWQYDVVARKWTEYDR